MASVLVHTADESITLTAPAAKRLLDGGMETPHFYIWPSCGTTARCSPGSWRASCAGSGERIEGAERVLRELGLLVPQEVPLEPADERPVYQRGDIIQRLEDSDEFRSLTAEVERRLGKKLTTPDIGVLLGLNDHLGLPADVDLPAGVPLCRAGGPPLWRGAPPRCARSRRRAMPGQGGVWIPRPPRRNTYASMPSARGRCRPTCGCCSWGTVRRPHRRRSISAPGRRWASRRRRWPSPMIRRC